MPFDLPPVHWDWALPKPAIVRPAPPCIERAMPLLATVGAASVHAQRKKGPAKSFTFIGSSLLASSTSGVATFSGVNIGAAASNRIVIVTVGASKSSGTWSGTIASVTINGNAATQANAVSNSASTNGVYYLNVPSGTTATIVVNLPSGADSNGIAIGIYRAVGLASATPTATATATASGAVGASLTIPSNGYGVGSAHHGSIAQAYSWTNLTGDYTGNPGAEGTGSSASSATAGAATRTATPASESAGATIVLAAWA